MAQPDDSRGACGGTTIDIVHVFCSTGRFGSLEELREYIDPAYTEDGDEVDSAFMREVELDEYEPNCIEAAFSESGAPVPLSELLKDASYADQWLPRLNGATMADAAICVYPPNIVEAPQNATLQYLGSYEFEVVHLEWFQKLLRGEPPESNP